VDTSKPKVHSESIVRSIVIRDVDGKRERVETIERCQNGKCEKEVRRSYGVDSEQKTLEKGSEGVQPDELGEPAAHAGPMSQMGIA